MATSYLEKTLLCSSGVVDAVIYGRGVPRSRLTLHQFDMRTKLPQRLCLTISTEVEAREIRVRTRTDRRPVVESNAPPFRLACEVGRKRSPNFAGRHGNRDNVCARGMPAMTPEIFNVSNDVAGYGLGQGLNRPHAVDTNERRSRRAWQ